MFGLKQTTGRWSWSASGKHPSARDFLSTGTPTALSKGISDWVDKGFESLPAGYHNGRMPKFWRFWARGAGKGEIACGVLRDSCDSVGRTYPFLVMGSGALPGWEEHWELLPYGCETGWKRIEYLCTRSYPDVTGIEQELSRLRPPDDDWKGFAKAREAGCGAGGFRENPSKPCHRRDENNLVVEMGKDMPDTLLGAGVLMKRMREQHDGIPNIAFIGGNSVATCLSVYWRPLQTADFATLWG